MEDITITDTNIGIDKQPLSQQQQIQPPPNILINNNNNIFKTEYNDSDESDSESTSEEMDLSDNYTDSSNCPDCRAFNETCSCSNTSCSNKHYTSTSSISELLCGNHNNINTNRSLPISITIDHHHHHSNNNNNNTNSTSSVSSSTISNSSNLSIGNSTSQNINYLCVSGSNGNINGLLSSSSSRKNYVYRNPITLVEEFSTSSLSEFGETECSLSTENIFSIIKDMEETILPIENMLKSSQQRTTSPTADEQQPPQQQPSSLPLQEEIDIKTSKESIQLSASTNSSSNNSQIQIEPPRKLSISASSIPIPPPSDDAVSPIALSCSAPSFPGILSGQQEVHHDHEIITANLENVVVQDITTDTTTPTNNIDTTDNNNTTTATPIERITTSSTTTTSSSTLSNSISTKTKKLLHSLKNKHHHNKSEKAEDGSSSSRKEKHSKKHLKSSTSAENISKLTTTQTTTTNVENNNNNNSNINNNTNSNNSNNDDNVNDKNNTTNNNSNSNNSNNSNISGNGGNDEDKNNSNNSNNKVVEEVKDKEEKEEKKEEDKENVTNNIIVVSNKPTTTTTTTTSTQVPPPLSTHSLSQVFTKSDSPVFISSSLPAFPISELIDEPPLMLMDNGEEEMPRGGRGRSNAFYMKGPPVMENGEFKIIPQATKTPSVQIPIPAVLPAQSNSLISKPIGLLSKLRRRRHHHHHHHHHNRKKESTTPTPSESTTSTGKESSTATTSTTTTTSTSSSSSSSSSSSTATTTTKKGSSHSNIFSQVVKGNSSRFIVGFADTIGKRSTMEDESVIYGSYRGKADEDYFGLFDGHGGTDAAKIAANELHRILAEKLKSGHANPVKCLKESFSATHALISERGVRCGTTAVVALFIGKKGYIANVGDSRAVLCRDGIAVRCSLDHKPNLPKEEERIKALGGTVVTTTNPVSGLVTSRVNGQLAVSRALGDSFLNPYVTCEPDIHGPINLETHIKNQFMIIACDGIWDVLSDEEAVSIAAPIADPEKACIKLRDQAFSRGSTDNISVLVIRFPPFLE